MRSLLYPAGVVILSGLAVAGVFYLFALGLYVALRGNRGGR